MEKTTSQHITVALICIGGTVAHIVGSLPYSELTYLYMVAMGYMFKNGYNAIKKS